MPKLKPIDPEVLRITPRPSVRQYHNSIMHDIMVRNSFPADVREMAAVLAESVRNFAEAEAVVIRAKADARLNNITAKTGESMLREKNNQ
jgi:hypothetical protein